MDAAQGTGLGSCSPGIGSSSTGTSGISERGSKFPFPCWSDLLNNSPFASVASLLHCFQVLWGQLRPSKWCWLRTGTVRAAGAKESQTPFLVGMCLSESGMGPAHPALLREASAWSYSSFFSSFIPLSLCTSCRGSLECCECPDPAKQPGLRLSQTHPTGWICAGERGPPPASQVCSPNPGENLDLGIWTL